MDPSVRRDDGCGCNQVYLLSSGHRLCPVIPAEAGIDLTFCRNKIDPGLRRRDGLAISQPERHSRAHPLTCSEDACLRSRLGSAGLLERLLELLDGPVDLLSRHDQRWQPANHLAAIGAATDQQQSALLGGLE